MERKHSLWTTLPRPGSVPSDSASTSIVETSTLAAGGGGALTPKVIVKDVVSSVSGAPLIAEVSRGRDTARSCGAGSGSGGSSSGSGSSSRPGGSSTTTRSRNALRVVCYKS